MASSFHRFLEDHSYPRGGPPSLVSDGRHGFGATAVPLQSRSHGSLVGERDAAAGAAAGL